MSTSSYSHAHRIVAYGFLGCLALMVTAGLVSAGHRTPGARTEPAAAHPSPADLVLTSASPPTRLRIPGLGLDARVVRLGPDAGGRNLALPPLRAAGWDVSSVTPGQRGITVIAGFIERSAGSPGALAHLRRLHRGDVVVLRRRDGARARYLVTRIAFYAKGHLPAAKVFAPTPGPELRLVSLGGPLHRGDPIGNAVVFARLAG
ncbi:class F sortase [Nocardioides ultimimeridianus]